ncbi:hypothetical protein H4582DRAFT_793966 [Lactarius indigo]|nr:hypothetical protein H4582DRAFT_793966 [Lactarius indigo]
MSARQPFLPSRPASRTVNRGDDAGTTPVRAALPNSNLPSDANDSAELGKPTRALNIASFKKSAPPRTPSFGTGAAEFEAAAQGPPRSAVKKGTTPARIYAPHPSTPSAGVSSSLAGFPTPEFKTPSLPFSRSADEGHTNAHISPPADATITNLNLFRPKSCAQTTTTRRPPPPSTEQSFFGNAKFLSSGGGGGSGDLDDSGYFSEHTDTEADRFAPVKHAAGDPRSVKAHAVPDDVDARFVNSTKRVRPASPGNDGDDEDGPMVQQSNRPRGNLPKRPCVRRSPSLSSRAAPDEEGAPAFVLPPHIPHPMAAMGDLPGLEFSEADLARYVELYEQGSERWSKAPMEEWVAGADDVLAKFGEMIDMIKDHMRCVSRSSDAPFLSFVVSPLLTRSEYHARAIVSSKMNLYKSLHTRLSDEHSALDQRAKELRGASQTLVRDSGTIGGAIDSHEIDPRVH